MHQSSTPGLVTIAVRRKWFDDEGEVVRQLTGTGVALIKKRIYKLAPNKHPSSQAFSALPSAIF